MFDQRRFEEILEAWDPGQSTRGGYKTEPDYPDMSITYDYFHYVKTGPDPLNLKAETHVEGESKLLLDFLAQLSIVRMFTFYPNHFSSVGEVCVRIMRYPPQPIKFDAPHLDACYFTVPLFDTTGKVGAPYPSAIAPHMDPKLVPHKHCFRASPDTTRFFGVAFLQVSDPENRYSALQPERTLKDVLDEALSHLLPYQKND